MTDDGNAEAINIVSREVTEVSFLDQWGDKRVIHRTAKGRALRVKKRDDSTIHLLNRAAAVLVGQRIRERRLAAGLTMAELHNKAGLVAAPGLEKNRMYEIETAGAGHAVIKKRGTFAGIRFGTLYGLAIALECEPSDLMPSAKEVADAAGVAFQVPAPRLARSA